ncbi:MAG: hypothetical protein HYV28_03885 [Ignavibacteriales bacterium]|nr:hypothetical protein [Ignavibacteriales bacterium]
MSSASLLPILSKTCRSIYKFEASVVPETGLPFSGKNTLLKRVVTVSPLVASCLATSFISASPDETVFRIR